MRKRIIKIALLLFAIMAVAFVCAEPERLSQNVNTDDGLLRFLRNPLFPGDVKVGDDLTVVGEATLTDAVTATAGVQSSAVTVIATSDGLTTGLIPSGTRFVTVTSDSAAKVVVLPAAVIGNIITITVPATGCELQTLAATNATINTVDCDGSNELALVAASVYQLTCTKAITWVATGASDVGANEDSLTPDTDS